MAVGMSFAESYAFFDSWVISALRSLGIDAWYAPLNDITSAGGKIGGAAQARRGGAILHHTTMAYQMNIPAMMEVLRIGQEKLSDKGIRSADKRVGPLRQQTDLPRQEIIDHLIAEFGALTDLRPGTLTDDARAGAEIRLRERFGTDAWRYIMPYTAAGPARWGLRNPGNARLPNRAIRPRTQSTGPIRVAILVSTTTRWPAGRIAHG